MPAYMQYNCSILLLFFYSFQQHEDVQKKVFRQQIQLALEIKMPLVIHCRDAEEDCLEILTEVSPNLVTLEDINCMVIHRLSKCKEKIGILKLIMTAETW